MRLSIMHEHESGNGHDNRCSTYYAKGLAKKDNRFDALNAKAPATALNVMLCDEYDDIQLTLCV